MTHAEAVILKASIEAALLSSSSSGAVSITHDGRSITYGSKNQASSALAELNRSIQAYNRKSTGRNPEWRSPIWR